MWLPLLCILLGSCLGLCSVSQVERQNLLERAHRERESREVSRFTSRPGLESSIAKCNQGQNGLRINHSFSALDLLLFRLYEGRTKLLYAFKLGTGVTEYDRLW